tara:strand:- start:7521 stop:8378 length:858 start_codon:yes stop_codon:yes gene_type:complete
MDAIKNVLNNFRSQDKIATEIIVGIIICIIILTLYYLSSSLINKITSKNYTSPVIYKGLKQADIPVTITQDPNLKGSTTLERSNNETTGIEYSYTVWLWIDTKTWNNTSKWKHVFHKGPVFESSSNLNDREPSNICQIQSPGLWLDYATNKLRLYVNTFGINNEYIEIDNLPLKKWVCFIYTQSNFMADVFINGRLKARKELKTLPRQNYADFHISQDDGFQGFLSQLTYYKYSLNSSEIHDMTEGGPSLKFERQYVDDASSVKIDNEIPYLSNRWWTNDISLEH